MIKLREFEKGAYLKKHLRDFLWMANFLHLEDKQKEKLFSLTRRPLIGCRWWRENGNITVGSCKFLKMSL